MRWTSLLLYLAAAAALVLVPPVRKPRSAKVRIIEPSGAERDCDPEFAFLERPDRTRITPWAPGIDFAYAAAEAGPVGMAGILFLVAFGPLFVGLWCQGVRCGLRRLLVTFALGVPACLALAYGSCFLPGRLIRLGPAASEWVPASLHTQTDRTTGLLSPRYLLDWHYLRHFRVVNISDKDTIAPGVEARKIARTRRYVPSLLVLVGAEWHGHPDLVLVHAKRDWIPRSMPAKTRMKRTIDGVRNAGGAVILAHPWAKLAIPLDEAMATGLDGVEAVNGVIHGGAHVVQAARRHQKAIVGTIDYKFGPHVNAMTLLPARLARDADGVVLALRSRQTRVLFAVPGGARTGTAWAAGEPGLMGTVNGLRTLLETSRQRRAIWLLWLVVMSLLWRLVSRGGATEGRLKSRRVAALLFAFSCLVEFAVPVCLSWQVRGAWRSIPVPVLIAVASIFAVPLLASSQVLARHAARRREQS